MEACEVYAVKLSETPDSDPLDCAMYFLACHKIEQAIDILATRSMFKEAVALAKSRLPEDSPIITELIEKWAKHCVSNGNFEIAAQCFIAIKKYEDAAKVLARRTNVLDFLQLAAELAEKADNSELYGAIQLACEELKANCLGKDVEIGGSDVNNRKESNEEEECDKSTEELKTNGETQETDSVTSQVAGIGFGDILQPKALPLLPSRFEAMLKVSADAEQVVKNDEDDDLD